MKRSKTRRGTNHPTRPIEKYNLRIQTALRTDKLDLSTKALWLAADAAAATDDSSDRTGTFSNSFVNLIPNESNAMEMVPWAPPSGEEGNGNEVEEEPQRPVEEERPGSGDGHGEFKEAWESNSEDGLNESTGSQGQEDLNNTGEYTFEVPSYYYEEDSEEDSASSPIKTASIKEQRKEEEEEEENAKEEKENAQDVDADISFRINVIPAEVLAMKNLKELWLCNNCISSVPSDIGDLRNLAILSLTNNRLPSIPPEVCLLDKLQALYLRGNRLSYLPNLFGRLRSLRTLDLAMNHFSEFPAVLAELRDLFSLDLAENRLRDLPMSIKQMKSLTYLNLTDNKIESPPEVLRNVPWMEVRGCAVPVAKRASMPFIITVPEEDELLGLLRSRASSNITNKLRRRKKKTSYT